MRRSTGWWIVPALLGLWMGAGGLPWPGFFPPDRSIAAETPTLPDDGRPATAPAEAGVLLPSPLPSPRAEVAISPDGASPVPRGWSLKEFVGKAAVQVRRVGHLFAVSLSSDSSSFSLYKDVEVDITQLPYLSWAWRVDRLPAQGDGRRKEADDQAAQVYIVFPRFPAMVRSQIIGYIWDSTAAAGTTMNSPSNPMAKVVVVRSGGEHLGRWLVETRNVLEDYQRLFGGTPPRVGRVSLLINSQHTKSAAQSWFTGLVFTQVPLARETGLAAGAPPVARGEGEGGPPGPDRVN